MDSPDNYCIFKQEVMNLILNNSNNKKGKLHSQPEVNPMYNSRGVHFCEDVNLFDFIALQSSAK